MAVHAAIAEACRDFAAATERRSGAERKRSVLHHAFAQLYHIVTDEWFVFAGSSGYPYYFYALIEEFFEIYRRDVLANIRSGDRATVPPFWRSYFTVADRAETLPVAYVRNVGLYHAAHAHTRYDLKCAIVGAWRACRAAGIVMPDREALRAELLGLTSDRIFSCAAARFLAADGDGGIRVAGCRAAEPLWLNRFQGWRRQAWADASAEIEACEIAIGRR